MENLFVICKIIAYKIVAYLLCRLWEDRFIFPHFLKVKTIMF